MDSLFSFHVNFYFSVYLNFTVINTWPNFQESWLKRNYFFIVIIITGCDRCCIQFTHMLRFPILWWFANDLKISHVFLTAVFQIIMLWINSLLFLTGVIETNWVHWCVKSVLWPKIVLMNPSIIDILQIKRQTNRYYT